MIADLILLAVFGVITWTVAGEGAWGAAQICLCVVFAGLVAMNFFEPLAASLGGIVGQYRADVVALVGLFAGLVFLARAAVEHLCPADIPVHPLLYEIGRWGAGALTGYLAVGILLTGLHTAPIPRTMQNGTPQGILGFTPERNNFFGFAPDRQWLAFTQFVTEHAFYSGRVFDGPRFQVGNIDNNVWPSFPIRYATRRENLAAGTTGGTGTTPLPTGGAPGPSPGGGGGGKAPGF